MSESQTTSAATLLSNDHSRMRRAERLIAKRDFQAALKYGAAVPSYNPRGELCWRYTFKDMVFIVDKFRTREITCWAKPGSGLDVAKRRITESMALLHQDSCKRLKNACNWTSHTIVVVDQSGSMRKTDVTGGATRSDAVWLTLAADFVAKHIETGKSTASDVVSIIAMCSESVVLIDRQPHDWLLFNRLVDLLREQEPHFDGNYIPALDAAERLLLANEFGACALTLFFLSDGKPSDRVPSGTFFGGDSLGAMISMMGKRIDSLASRFGRRLSVITVGFAGPGEDFRVLQKLAERPKQFGSLGLFHPAQLNPDALGTALSSLTSTLTATRTELTAVGGATQREVRDVRRQARDSVGQDLLPNANWYTYFAGPSWRGERTAWKPTGRDKGWFKIPPIHDQSVGVALNMRFFGEGAERLVREFREIGPDGYFVGPRLVAKESRFQADVANLDRKDIINFHKAFCDTQTRAQGLAKVFNEKLAQLPGFDPKTTPTISFLECSVYEVNDVNLGSMFVLVEKQLDPAKYKKWNDNQGHVDGQVPVQVDDIGGLGAIIESDEDSEEDSEDDEGNPYETAAIRIEDIPQAFSHWTYRFTKRRLLVCDLQGVLSTQPPCFELTDPVIHFESRNGRRNVFGRTDRGPKGVNDFFRSHTCGPLCHALNRRWVKRVAGSEKQRESHLDGLEDQVSNLVI